MRSLLVVLCLAWSQSVYATVDYCRADTRSNVRLGHGSIERSPINAGGEVKVTTNEAGFGWLVGETSRGSMLLDWNMLYTILDFDAITPMTNGHLHTWDLSMIWLRKFRDSVVRYSIIPAISVSSNALKNPDLIDGDGMQLKTAVTYKKYKSQGFSWVAGFMSDHRFGDYLLYPVAGVCIKPSNDWLLQVAVPDFNVQKTFSSGVSLMVYVAPEGNQWHVFSRDTLRDSDLNYEAISMGVKAHWQVSSSIRLTLDYKKQTRRKFSLVLDDNTQLRIRAGSSSGLGVRAEIFF